ITSCGRAPSTHVFHEVDFLCAWSSKANHPTRIERTIRCVLFDTPVQFDACQFRILVSWIISQICICFDGLWTLPRCTVSRLPKWFPLSRRVSESGSQLSEQGASMHVEMRDIGSIRPYPHNPRHNDRAVAAVAASIRAFGFQQPLVLDADGVIVVGE